MLSNGKRRYIVSVENFVDKHRDLVCAAFVVYIASKYICIGVNRKGFQISYSMLFVLFSKEIRRQILL